jgi:2-methylcitrate dehydratase PrpD
MDDGYRIALTDWLACASAGRSEEAAEIASAEGAFVAAAVAGHILDFDDTYLPGIAHLSAPVAPVACLLGAEVGARVGDVLDAYAAGFEVMGAVARASHPQLYNRGWHPTSVCGVIGAATAAARLLALSEERMGSAVAIAQLAAGGLRAAFGSHGKSLQVGFAAAAGVRAARLAAAGAGISAEVPAGFETVYGATLALPDPDRLAISDNWIKAYPSCLQTHSSIEAAEQARSAGMPRGPTSVVVHPVSRQAAAYDDVSDGLQAKFSIPYTVAFTLLNGPPGVRDFDSVDESARDLARSVDVVSDPSLLESEAILYGPDGFEARIEAALGSPACPMTATQLASKVEDLVGDSLHGILDDPNESAKALVEAARLQ